MRAASVTAAGVLTALVVTTVIPASAHRHDEYLQAARIAIEPSAVRLEVSLTPGIAVADAVIGEIDVNGDTVLSAGEQRVYAKRVMQGLQLRIDGMPAPLTLSTVDAPRPDALRGGDAAVTLLAETRLLRLATGAHTITFRNGNATHGAVYLANALLPDDDRVAITAMTHEVDQRGLTVAFTLRPSSVWWWPWAGASPTS